MQPQSGSNKLTYFFAAVAIVALATVAYFVSANMRLSKKLAMEQKTAAEQQKNARAHAKKTPELPSNLVKITECIAHEGEHWVDPKNVPNGPYYIVYNKKVMGVEYMFEESTIPGAAASKMSYEDTVKYMKQNNLSLSDLVESILNKRFNLFDYSYKNFTINWIAPHAAVPEPHYDIHFFLVDQDEMKNVCPESTIEGVYSADVMSQIHEHNIPFPGEKPMDMQMGTNSAMPMVTPAH